MKRGKMMTGVLVNVVAIIVGSILGLVFKKFIKPSYKETIMNGLALTVLIMGIMNVIDSNQYLIVIISIVLGSLIGELLDIEGKINSLTDALSRVLGRGNSENSTFSEAFVTTTLIFCVGAMAILGSLESGLLGNHDTLFAKSLLDGIASIIFASTLGIGVMFSALVVFFYQGAIVLGATLLKDLLTPEMITEISAVGGILIIAIALNILEIKKIKIGNMLPAIVIPVIYFLLL